jgi:hypothetical protein
MEIRPMIRFHAVDNTAKAGSDFRNFSMSARAQFLNAAFVIVNRAQLFCHSFGNCGRLHLIASARSVECRCAVFPREEGP